MQYGTFISRLKHGFNMRLTTINYTKTATIYVGVLYPE